MNYKNKLIDLLELSYREELEFNSSLSEEERSATGTSDHWSIKDEVMHITVWKGIMHKRFVAALENKPPPSYDDLDVANEEIFERYKDENWKAVEEFQGEAYHKLVEGIEKISEEELMDSERYEWLKGRSLWERTLHTGYFHPLWHLAMQHIIRGDSAAGSRIMEDVTRKLIALEESSPRKGQYIYNLACYYALSGDQDRSLENLEQAFSLNSDIIEWSKKDTDLDSLWVDPRYISLVGGSEGIKE